MYHLRPGIRKCDRDGMKGKQIAYVVDDMTSLLEVNWVNNFVKSVSFVSIEVLCLATMS